MKLERILTGIDYKLIKGNINSIITDICYNSNKVINDSLFICLKGSYDDGHNYIDTAIKKGASTIIIERDIDIKDDVNVIRVENTRRILSKLSINFFDNPGSKMTLIGITGTKGKTTTSWMIKNILEEEGKKVGLIGTLGVFFNGKHYSTINTTPESYEIQKYFKEMVDNDVEYAIMEVSSQALKVGRVDGIIFDYGVFTNLTRDHIGDNEHLDMEDYIYSKSLLFKMCKKGIFNIDDNNFNNMIKDSTCEVYTYGHSKDANLIINKVELLRKEHFIGVNVSVKGIINDNILINTPGEFSAYNGICATLVTYLIGCNLSNIKKALSKVAVKGRVEIVPVSNRFSVIIDYAHNGVSLENILTTMKDYNPKRIISLFGCGGNRSKERRYDMGEISGKYSDLTIITEDNSRFEDVNDIMNDIEKGIKKTSGKYIKINDRTKAISYAINNAIEGDIILLLGKGHETYQEKNGNRIHYDEREEIKKVLDIERNDEKMIPFKKANILIPKNVDMTKWSVVACDQYTSEPDYWNRVDSLVGDSPSTLRITLPEIYLEEENVSERISKINKTMEEYLNNDMFTEYKDSMIYLERTQADGRVREGLIGIVDLEDYSYEKGSQTLIRATEKTVIERIPPRLKVRENALLELPHIMILIDDEKKNIIENLKNEVTEENKVYDFDLMENGGHIKGYVLNDDSCNSVINKLEALIDKDYFENKYNVKDKGLLLFAMGDGNHSLATAKANYENLKKTMSEEEYLNNPARYALVELVNLHSPALEFEPIHRVIFNTDVNKLIDSLYKYYDINEEGNGEYFELVTKDMDKKLYISNPKSNISVGSIQIFLDEYLKENTGKLDYIHGDETTRNMGREEGNVAILFEAMPKDELFRTVILDGALPRKTFSMGHSYDKRYYLESRKIK